MATSPAPAALGARLRECFAADEFTLDEAERTVYGYDNSRREALPDAVVFPTMHDQVVALVRICRELQLPLVARGRGTNTTGATVPVAGGIVASFERMNRILAIDADNRIAVVEPGVLNADLQAALKPHGFFWAPDPTSAPFCSIAGNIGCNAGGPRAVKYGATRDNVLALRAVGGTGEAFRCGKPTTKGATGYDLVRLLVGSEGTLAVVTEATLKLTPIASAVRTLRATYADIGAAAAAVARIMAQPVTPCALEFLDDEALRLAREHGGEAIPQAGAMLVVEVDGEADTLSGAADAIARAARGDGLLDWHEACDATEVERIWAARKALSPALRTLAPNKINEDVVVPVSRVPALIAGLKALSQRFAIPIVNFGHAGNGNIHVNLLYRPDDATHAANVDACLDAVFALVLDLDGTLSGEHGIGLAKRPFMTRALDPVALDLMHAIKRQFDPDGILNPGKLLP
ncbi:MAG TPA: FAD-linked oxidase C-terminal domain-containing protein [Dokdonella sp.]|uniref:FAD-binding oxidoreductase n=1 Tax=Dokdonella sp. TaxID=2291710 RepID=UPI0025C616F6|nr:FAD-linked oxidase C-terminal domain-containing protein [Dokdonella sp.]MBX3692444.1 FAD-binding protein [Dokdonella sp.]MCW5568051.1 FAD-binding protein [Dokdonella sp.]HNR92627.1 FAD-linked oxidase C-terminal domain-containing protein [Dokdonella sp.]